MVSRMGAQAAEENCAAKGQRLALVLQAASRSEA
jgi:hypothetical protein